MSPVDLPPITYPPELPVSARREDIARAIERAQVVIVAGATGSGKTTQLPKILLELGRERIGHTQPRRIAARSIAERVAEELGVELGGLVGYQVRFTDTSSADTRVKLMTDGILLAEINRDRELRRYDTIVIDEAHERSLTIDFLLGYLKQLLPRRPDLKLVITSATIDPESFARHFADAEGNPAEIVEVSGRTYPVEVRYRPLVAEGAEGDADEDAPDAGDRDQGQGIVEALRELEREEAGDVLVFLSGENEIRDAEDAIRGSLAGRAAAETEILPLYGRLSAADQHRVFGRRGHGIRRRIVLSTNVAETSLTVPGIKYVIDAGTARISRYSARAKVQRLPIEAISQASANQRSGRAGRTSDGIAIRLYSEDDYARRPEYTDPEILRTNLAAVILQMISLGLGDIQEFPFLQPPDSRGVADGLDLLRELGAIAPDRTTGTDRITRTGRDLARLPVDPRFGRMLVEAGRQGVVREVAAIVAGLSLQDVRERPLEERAKADALHARFADPTSDFLGLLKLWRHLERERRERSGSAFRRMARAEYLNYLRIREWQDLEAQLRRAAKDIRLEVGPIRDGVDADAVHKALLAGLLSRIGLRDDRQKDQRQRGREYLGSRGQRFMIFPGSSLAKKGPPAVMAAELVETSRLFARTAGAIDPLWAEQLAGDLVKRQYSDPHWEQKQGAAIALERATLYGVPIVQRRKVQLARVDRPQARELLIRHALVGGEWPGDIRRDPLYDFDRANRALRRELGEMEERTRRRDILVDDEAVVDFYEARIPEEVASVREFEGWWRRERRDRPRLLEMTRDDLLGGEGSLDETAYPSEWRDADQRLALRYRFEPGASDDGVTVDVPLALLPRIESAGFDWLVPGMREELVTALLKTLPKAIRRNVVPAGDWARRLIAQLPEQPEGPLTTALAGLIRQAAHVPVAPEDFDLDRLPPHLRVSYAAVDERGRRVGRSKDLEELRGSLGERARQSVARAATTPQSDLERSGLTAFDLEELPEHLDVRQGGNTIRAYPALVDEGASVAVRLLGTRAEQEAAHGRGILRLLALATPSPAPHVQEHLTHAEKLALATSPYRSTAALMEDALQAAIGEVVRGRAPRTSREFEALRAEVADGLLDRVFAVVAQTAAALQAAREADRAIAKASTLALMSPLAEARAQLDALVHPGFVAAAGAERLRRIPVYLRGIVYRVERMAENLGRDRQWMTEVEQAVELYRKAGGTLPLPADAAPRLREVRWMLEELRLSLFAQPLGAQGPVSVARIRKALEAPAAPRG
ncbi:ATP-dependent RNA helicase HrpA [Homoserinibacter sp. YIM 151385]|uniref:ATP-dependent RNA helicase HrpA n=1 Tax=Homoserinibacter sp. YIM 151385 TaxID=2985506 RepID=UPI0022F0D867|nr:ATP-dependent RNA helicase HrpA [Homoserinibacter sp. YIM 151385]WBU37964.1 ATP-dependent RNA helicase HrpA [Homoserinibacter sp. YIM 151385]